MRAPGRQFQYLGATLEIAVATIGLLSALFVGAILSPTKTMLTEGLLLR
jgi:hypothetical protein